MRLIRWLGIALIAIVGLLTAIVVGARFSDGPVAIIAGGPLRAGELVVGPEPDWSFARDTETIEFQLLTPPRSRTTWVLEHEGKIYVPCGYMNSFVGRLWKKWPIEAEQDGRAIVRIEGKRYERQLVRVTSPALFDVLTKEIRRKYQAPVSTPDVEANAVWLFELAPRPETGA
jgi:hypothetical protein